LGTVTIFWVSVKGGPALFLNILALPPINNDWSLNETHYLVILDTRKILILSNTTAKISMWSGTRKNFRLLSCAQGAEDSIAICQRNMSICQRNISQQRPKRKHHVAPNNVAIFCVDMLRSFVGVCDFYRNARKLNILDRN